jgi:Site-specific recombinase XerD
MPTWKREPLEDYEVDELIDQAASMSGDHELVIRVLLHTGMRAAEFEHMQSDWVNWRKEEIRIQPTGDWTPKSEAGNRVIPLRDPDVKRLLNDHFSRHDSIDLSRTTIWRRTTEVADETSITKKVTPHVLRHTYGTMIASEGASAQFLKQTMGHTNLSTSQQYIEYSGRRIHQEADQIWN